MIARAVLVFERVTDDPIVTGWEFRAEVTPFPAAPPFDFANATLAFDAMWSALTPLYPSSLTFRHVRWYVEDDEVPPFGDVVATVAVDEPGTGLGHSLPGQVACTITKEHDIRPSWGRSYFPPPCAGLYTSGGRLEPSVVEELADRHQVCLDRLYDDQGLRAVCRATIQGGPLTGEKIWAEVTHVRVDDILDVMRSRRPENRLVLERRALDDTRP